MRVEPVAVVTLVGFGEIMEFGYVTIGGRIVIPARLRRKLAIKPGNDVCFVELGNDILFQPVTKKSIRSLCGLLKSKASVTQELLDKRREDRGREEAKHGRSL